MPRKVRDYAKERKYDSKPEVKARRAARGRARYKMIKAGKARVGDGKDVNHKKPLSKGGGNGKGNLEMSSPSKNRSYARTKTGAIKGKSRSKKKK